MAVGRRNVSQCGLTLIELMVSLFILVIIVTLAVPSYKAMVDRERVVAASNNVLFSFRYAREFAVSHRLDDVRVDLGGAQGWPITVIDPRDDSVIFRRDVDSSDISLSWAGGGGVSYTRYGRPASGESVCVMLNGVLRREVRVNLFGVIDVMGLGDEFKDCN